MVFSEKCEQVAAALVRASGMVRFVGKTGTNQFHKYTYAKLDDYVRATSQALADCDIMLMTSVAKAESLDIRKNRKGNDEYPVRVTLTMRAVHKSGEWAEVNSMGDGQDGEDKALYKAMTGARKYAIAMLLGLATSDDLDEDNAAPPPPQRAAPPKPTTNTPPTIKQLLAAEIADYSGIASNSPDFKAAAHSTITAAGLDAGGSLSDTQADIVRNAMLKARTDGIDWMTFVNRNKQ